MERSGPSTQSFVSQRLRLRYVDWGNPEAPPLILQHGGRDHCRSWDWVAEALRDEYHVIAPDLRGHGDSDWSPDGDYAMHSFVYDFAQFVHTLGYDQVNIVAHSLGGNIATRFTGLYPEKVRRFVNIEGLGLTVQALEERAGRDFAEHSRTWIAQRRKVAGVMPRRYTTFDQALARMKEANSYLSDEQARHLTFHAARRNEDGTWSWKYDNYLNPMVPGDATVAELHALWEAITCPVLLLWGKDSFFSSPGEDGRLAHFANARLIVYENAGHWLHHDQFDRFIGDVRAFLAA